MKSIKHIAAVKIAIKERMSKPFSKTAIVMYLRMNFAITIIAKNAIAPATPMKFKFKIETIVQYIKKIIAQTAPPFSKQPTIFLLSTMYKNAISIIVAVRKKGRKTEPKSIYIIVLSLKSLFMFLTDTAINLLRNKSCENSQDLL